MGRKECTPGRGVPSGLALNAADQEVFARKRMEASGWRVHPSSSVPPRPRSPDQASYLSGKETLGPVFAQGREATRPRTLARADGLLSRGQDLIQFVWGEAEEGRRHSAMEIALASETGLPGARTAACENQKRTPLPPPRWTGSPDGDAVSSPAGRTWRWAGVGTWGTGRPSRGGRWELRPEGWGKAGNEGDQRQEEGQRGRHRPVCGVRGPGLLVGWG